MALSDEARLKLFEKQLEILAEDVWHFSATDDVSRELTEEASRDCQRARDRIRSALARRRVRH